MVGILSQGRLGNQMFQFAFIFAVSKKLETPFFILNYNSLHYFELYENFKKNNNQNILKFAIFNTFRKSKIPFNHSTLTSPIKWLISRFVYKNVIRWDCTIEVKNHLLTRIEDNILYNGYFQSEDYFIHLKKDLQKFFKIRDIYQQRFLVEKKALFYKKTIGIHIRRTDYVQFGDHGIGGSNMTLPISYYKKCLNLIKNIEDYNIIFVSDDIEFAKKEFGIKNNFFYENNSEIIDFQLLLNSDILIIANSSFSWWAAWLNKNKHKTIFAPNYYLGFKINEFYPQGIKVNSWEWIDVN